MKNLTEKKMEKNELYKYLHLPDDYLTITTNMDIEFQYEQEEESK